jgi:hypothetical protein
MKNSHTKQYDVTEQRTEYKWMSTQSTVEHNK